MVFNVLIDLLLCVDLNDTSAVYQLSIIPICPNYQPTLCYIPQRARATRCHVIMMPKLNTYLIATFKDCNTIKCCGRRKWDDVSPANLARSSNITSIFILQISDRYRMNCIRFDLELGSYSIADTVSYRTQARRAEYGSGVRLANLIHQPWLIATVKTVMAASGGHIWNDECT